MLTDKELAELDLAVAKVEGRDCFPAADFSDGGTPRCWEVLIDYTDGLPPDDCEGLGFTVRGREVVGVVYQPTRDGAEAMRLLEKYQLDLLCGGHGGDWYAEGPNGVADSDTTGPTPEIAICHAVVALKDSSPRSDTK